MTAQSLRSQPQLSISNAPYEARKKDGEASRPAAARTGLPPASVDLIIPAINEEENIPALFTALRSIGFGEPGHWLRHVILADNGSTDATPDLAVEAGGVVVREPRRGYGSACLAGLRWIAGDVAIKKRPGGTGAAGVAPCSAHVASVAPPSGPPTAVAFLDADLADDPANLVNVVQPILNGSADMVIANRPRLAEPGSLTLPQRVGNAFACTLIRAFTGERFHDLGPMRALRWESLCTLDMEDTTWGWTVEMQYKAAAMGLRNHEIDTPYRQRRAGTSKISGTIIGSAKAGYKITSTLLTLKLRDMAGKL